MFLYCTVVKKTVAGHLLPILDVCELSNNSF